MVVPGTKLGQKIFENFFKPLKKGIWYRDKLQKKSNFFHEFFGVFVPGYKTQKIKFFH